MSTLSNWIAGCCAVCLVTPALARAPLDVLRESNSHIHRFTMPNGITGVIKPDHSAPVVAIQLWFGTGSIHEDNFLGAGLSHYVEHMIFKGTPTRTTGDITRELDSAGGRVNAYTTFDRTVFHVVLPSENWEIGLDVLSDAVMNAAFPEDEWEREQTVILQEMAMNRDDPNRELSRLLWSTAYRVHPHQHPVIGHKEVFLQTSRDDLISFFQRHYTPDNMIFAVAGDIDPVQVEQRAREAFDGFERRMRRPVILPAEPPQMAPRFARQTGDYEMSRAAWGWHTVPLHHPDAAALDVLSVIVGGGESSRLAIEIRDRRQLVHSIRAWSYAPAEPGLFGIHATFDPDKEAEVLDAVREEIARWRDTPFTEQEIEKARRQVLMSTLTALQTMRGQVNSVASGEFYAGDPQFPELYLERVEAVTPQQLQDLVRRYLRDENRTLALLTPDQPEMPEEAAREAALIQSPVRMTLDNGIPLIVREDHRLPLVHVTVAMLGGLLSEAQGNEGLTQFTAELLTRGTHTRSAQEIAERLETLGASVSPFSGLNSFGLQGMALSEDLGELLETLSQNLVDPAFPETEVERQRRRQLAEIRARRENPLQIADDMVRKVLYGNHPYRWSPAGETASVSQFTADDLQNHLSRHLVSGNIAISIFGSLPPEDALDLANRYFGNIPQAPTPLELPPLETPELPTKVKGREPRQQSIFLMAFPGVDLKDARADALDVLQSAMSGLSSNLGMEVREKRGLVYFVGAFQRLGLAPGRFVLFAGTFEEAIPELESLMEQEIERVVTTGLTEEELSRAQAQLIGDFHANLQNNSTLAQMSALNELYGLGYDYEFKREQRLRNVTNEDIRSAAEALLDKNRRVTATVLPMAPADDAND